MSLLKTKISDFRYDEGNLSILKNIDLEIGQGELIVITGLSGCGKTTLTRILNGLIPHHYGGNFNGAVKLFDKNLLDYEKGELAKYIGNVFQNPSDQFFATIAEEEVAFVGENLGMPLEELKQKVAIASTLLYDTKIIFFDEPSSNLDYQGIVQFRNIVCTLREMGKTVVY